MEEPPSGCDSGKGRAVGGGDLYFPPPEQRCTLYRYLYDHGPVSGGGAAPWGVVFQEVSGTREYGPGGGTDGNGKGGGGRGGRIGDRNWDRTQRTGGLIVATNKM